MAAQRLFKPLAEVVPGDVLAQDIGDFKELRAGTILDHDRILLLQSLGLLGIEILASGNLAEQSRLRTDALSRFISERIGRLHRVPPPSTPAAEEPPTPSGPSDRAVLDHVRESREDIRRLEDGEKVSLASLDRAVNNAIASLQAETRHILVDRSLDPKRLRGVVEELVALTAPKREASLLLLGIVRKGAPFLVKHSVNTCLIGLATAIELTKMMDARLQQPEVMGDPRKLRICDAKMFNHAELVTLGMAAVLHDIGIAELFPSLTETTALSEGDRGRLLLHPSRAYSLLSSLNLDFDVRKAILQHHERVDGSGYPDGAHRHLLSKHSLVLSFASHFELLTSRNPFQPHRKPPQALLHILQKERPAFDDDVLFAFCRAASLYPVGSWVVLSDDTVALVVRSNRHDLRRPVVKAVYSADLRELASPQVVDLSASDLSVKDILEVESLEIFDPRYERFIFDERESRRVPLETAVRIRVVGSEVQVNGLTENLSPSGLRFRTGLALSKGQHIRCSFSVAERRLDDLLGLVVWSNRQPSGETLCGVRFLGLDRATHDFLRSLVAP